MLNAPDTNDPLEKAVRKFDPMGLAASNLLDGLIKREVTSLVKEEICKVDKDTILNDYLFEARFIPYFNNVLLKNVVKEVAQETVIDVVLGEALEDIIEP